MYNNGTLNFHEKFIEALKWEEYSFLLVNVQFFEKHILPVLQIFVYQLMALFCLSP